MHKRSMEFETKYWEVADLFWKTIVHWVWACLTPDTLVQLNHLNILEIVESEICTVFFKCSWKIDLQ